MNNRVKWPAITLAGCLLTAAISNTNRSAPAALSPLPVQDIMSVDRRVSTLEQRIFTIESNIGQLQQQINMIGRSSTPSSGATADVQQVRLELDLLRSQIGLIQCAIAKLDERTLQSGKPKRNSVKDPCRLDLQTPIEQPSHPY